MRISAWSSDLCSSDLIERHLWHRVRPNPGVELAIRVVPQGDGGGKNPLRIFLMVAVVALSIAAPYIGGTALGLMTTTGGISTLGAAVSAGIGVTGRLCVGEAKPPQRSEEHTSELQSLMRISYAVLCLKKKKKT